MRCVIAVGYINTDGVTGGQLVNAAFLNPGKKTFNVSDIAITGYQEDAGFYESGDFTCNFYVLDSAGRTIAGKDKFFLYSDTWDWDSYAFLGGKWYNNGTVEIIPGGENDFALDAGLSVWLQLPENDGSHTFQFGSAGEVIQAEIPFPLVTGGNGVGNPMAVPVWVSDLTVTGYEEDAGFYESGDFNCNFYILDSAGRTIAGKNKFFLYSDTWDWDQYAFLGGKWFNNGTMDITPKSENDFQLPPGCGVWLQVPENDGEHTFVLTFPQVVGEQAAN